MSDTERAFMTLSIREAQKSRAEDQRVHPKVGAVVVKDNQVIAVTHRDGDSGDHAEFNALEKLLANDVIAGATVYTTLEPCTTRNHPKVSCAERLIERRVGRVVIGMIDPNPEIRGKGIIALRGAGIVVDLYPHDLVAEIEDLNRHFIRQHKASATGDTHVVSEEWIKRNHERHIDDWFRSVNATYSHANYYRDVNSIFSHLVEIVGALSLLASEKKKEGIEPEKLVPKAVAWWMALCWRCDIRSVADMLWAKFPGVCPYCLRKPHDNDDCRQRGPNPAWQQLKELGDTQLGNRPSSLGEWQRMFLAIYPTTQTEGFSKTFARLTEELGELAEAVRVLPITPGFFASEAADVFAWLMHIQNLIDQRNGVPKYQRGVALQRLFAEFYPDQCVSCHSEKCACPPILPETVGRIAHEVPPGYRT